MSFVTGKRGPIIPASGDEAVIAELKRLSKERAAEGLALLPPLSSSLEEFYVEVPVDSADGSTWQSLTKVIRPKLESSSGKARPLIIHFHGGGFMFGSQDDVTSPAREWAEKFNATVILPSYRHTPEVRFPVPMLDGVSVTRTIAKGWAPSAHARYFGANPSDGFVISGTSAGAIICGVSAGLASFSDDPKDHLDVPLTGVFFSVPWFFRDETVPEEYRSIWTATKENEFDEALTAADVDSVYDSLHVVDPRTPLLSPAWFFQDGRQPRNGAWPPTYFQACHYDPTRDNAVIFEKMLAKVGTKTKIHILPDDGHQGMGVVPAVHKSKNPTLEENTMEAMAWLLGQEV